MIARLEEELEKEVGLMHHASMTRPTDEVIIRSMLKDIKTFDYSIVADTI